MTARFRVSMWLAAMFLSPLPSTLPLQSRQTFRAGVDLVQLNVVVLDRHRRPVTGLTAADFTITEDGQPREVEAFAAITLPRPDNTGAAWPRDAAPDVVDNQRTGNGRLVVVMLDHSITAGPVSAAARTIARSAIDALGPNDLAAVVRSSPFAGEGLSQNFTANRRLLFTAIDSPFMGLTRGAPNGPGGGSDRMPDLSDSIACPCGVCQWFSIARVADALASSQTSDQKILLFIGRDIVVQASAAEDDCNFRVRDARNQAFRALDRANVTVHSIDPSGLETLQATASGAPRIPPMQHLARQANLGVLPDYTGGRTVLNTNRPETIVPNLLAESESYYLLAFQRTPGARPDERRNIRVRVNRDGASVLSRTGYYARLPPVAGAGSEPDPLSALLPAGGIPMTMAITPRFLPDGRSDARVLLGITTGTSAVGLAFDVTIGVFDAAARPVGSERQRLELQAAPTPGGMAETVTTLPLAPGRYEVRIGVVDATSQRTGSVYGYVDVPDLARTKLALSGVTFEVRDKVDVSAPAAFTVRRTFSKDERVNFAAQVFNRDATRAPASFLARVVASDGRIVASIQEAVDASRFSASGVAHVRVALPLATLDAGQYLLDMQVTNEDESSRQSALFRVQ
jgi:VWFA-related protein